jgi:integrase
MAKFAEFTFRNARGDPGPNVGGYRHGGRNPPRPAHALDGDGRGIQLQRAKDVKEPTQYQDPQAGAPLFTVTPHVAARRKYEERRTLGRPRLGVHDPIRHPIARASLITHSFKPLLRRADLPDIRFHDLRHTCATLLLSKGVHVKLVQELLGHSTIAVTLDTYSHVLPGMGEGIANTMDEVLS